MVFSVLPAFADSDLLQIENPSYYELKIDEHTFSIPYDVDGNVLAMAVDQELTSFLIGLDKTSDSIMVIELDNQLISAENNQFAVLVNGLEVDYNIVSNENSSVLSFFVPAFTEEVEIIGTHVIPEFPYGIILIFSIVVLSSIVMSKTKIPIFKL
ncbi:MAG: hypothetical protein R3327_06000 [Nitrosopumilaceae archaeon]|nr:hypothetical protein [Nitrosopumilaceae archaeon]